MGMNKMVRERIRFINRLFAKKSGIKRCVYIAGVYKMENITGE